MSAGSFLFRITSPDGRYQLPSWAVDVACLALVFVVFHGQGILTGALPTAGMDMSLFTQPLTEFTVDRLRDGELPLWNPYWLGGFPHLEQPRVGFLYPSTLVFLAMEFPMALKFDVLLHLFYAGICAYVLGRDYGFARPVAVLLGVLTFSGPFGFHVSQFGHLFALHALSHLPLALWLLRRALRRESNWYALGFGFVLAVQGFAGDPQFYLYCLTLYGIYTAGWSLAFLVWSGFCYGETALRAATIACALALALALQAVQILPARELLEESIRGVPVHPKFSDSFSSDWKFYWAELTGGEIPWLKFGTPFVAGAVLPLLLLVALSAPAAWKLSLEIGILVFFVMFSIMPQFFVDYVLALAPIFLKARAHMRTAYLAIFVYHILLCYGLQRLWHARSDSKKDWWTWFVFASALSAYACWLIANERLYEPILVAEAAAGLGLLAALLTLRSVTWWMPRVAVVLVALESFAFLGTQVRLWQGVPGDYVVDNDFVALSEQRVGRDRIALFSPEFPTLDFPQSMGLRTQDRVFGGYEGLFLERTSRFLDASAGLGLVLLSRDGRFLGEDFRKYPSDWVTENSYDALDLFNVRYLVAKDMELGLPERESAQGGRFRRTEFGDLVVYENLEAFPIAFTAHEVECFPSDEKLRDSLRNHKHDLRNTALLSHPCAGADEVEPQLGEERVDVLHYGENELELSVTMLSAGFLVLTDVYYPGWRAYLNGAEELEVQCVYSVMRGVLLPKGEHRVRFVYRPTQYVYGALVSAFGLFGAAAWAWRVGRRGTKGLSSHG